MPKKGAIRNLNRAILKIELLKGVCIKELASKLYTEAEYIMSDSKENYVPVDTGALRASGQVRKGRKRKTKASVTLGFGNVAVGYGLYVHEDLTAYHPTGQSKYLEVPFKTALVGMAKRISDHLRSKIKRVV